MTRTINLDPPDSGPCAKMVVKATLVAPNGNRYVATNYCMSPKTECARAGMPSGVGYHLCVEVCEQVGHAEVNAVTGAGPAAKDSVVYLEGHTYACSDCIDTCKAAGVKEIVIGPPEDL